jgi:hypothetical protein
VRTPARKAAPPGLGKSIATIRRLAGVPEPDRWVAFTGLISPRAHRGGATRAGAPNEAEFGRGGPLGAGVEGLMTRSRMGSTPRKPTLRQRSTSRAARYDRVDELRAAVLAWCRDWVREQDPTWDVARLESDLRSRAQRAPVADEAFEQWCAMREALERARTYLEANPLAPSENIYAAMIKGFFETACRGNAGDFDASIGERLTTWRPTSKQDLWPYGFSTRAQLVAMFVNLSGPVVRWGDRPPKVRDLAVINLLRGCGREPSVRRRRRGSG